MSGKVKLIVAAFVGVVVISVGVALFMMGRQPANETSNGEQVWIEVRSFPAMTLAKDGKKLGRTPVSFWVAKSNRPIALDTEWTEQRIYRKGGAKMIPRQAHKEVIPDHTQTVDITVKDAKPVVDEP